MNSSSASEMDVVDLTQSDDDDDDSKSEDEACCGTKRGGSSNHPYNTRSTGTRAVIKIEKEYNSDLTGGTPPSSTSSFGVIVTPEKNMDSATASDKNASSNSSEPSLEEVVDQSGGIDFDIDHNSHDVHQHRFHEFEEAVAEGEKEVEEGAEPESDADASIFGSSDAGDVSTDDIHRSIGLEEAAVESEERGEEESVGSGSDDNASLFGNSGDEGEDKGAAEDAGDESNDDNSLFGNSDDESSRFSGGENELCATMTEDKLEESPSPHQRSAKKQKIAKPRTKKVLSEYLAAEIPAPPEERMQPECYYLNHIAHLYGRTLRKLATRIGDGPPQRYLDDRNEERFELICHDIVSRKGTGIKQDKMGSSYYKSYYLGIGSSDKKDDELSLRSFLSKIVDFESLVYEHGPQKAISRLMLLLSTACCLPGTTDRYCLYFLPKQQFKVIDDNGHMGCGFIDPEFLFKLLGKSAKARDVFAVQVRMIASSSFGLAKGMLQVKQGMEGHKVEIPTSMIKAERSKDKEPFHKNEVVLVITHCFPSAKSRTMDRLLDDRKKDPTPLMIKGIEEPRGIFLNVLRCKGVNENIIETYRNNLWQATKRGSDIEQAVESIKHGSLIGVTDPTGHIPEGLVFLTGFGERAPSRTFLTRSPCTEGKDGVIARVVTRSELPEEAFRFLNSLPFGAVVFALGADPMPPSINDGDLDGDLYHAIWDPSLLEGVQQDDEDANLGKMVEDELIGTEFQHEYEGKEYTSTVVQWLREDLYSVATGKDQRNFIEMTREQITDGRYYIDAVVDHRIQGPLKHGQSVEFKCVLSSGNLDWLSMQKLRKDFGDSPPCKLTEYVFEEHNHLLADGVLPKKFCNWLKNSLDTSEMKKIIKHRKRSGKIEVLCEYDDGDVVWIDLEETKRDSKIFVGAYAKKKNLLGRPGWVGVEGYWLDEVQDLMRNVERLAKLNTVTRKLHGFWKKSIETKGSNHNDTIIWGRAYKTSNDIKKHDVIIKLPLHLWLELPKSCQKYIEAIGG